MAKVRQPSDRSVFELSSDEIDEALRLGNRTAELSEYFGPERFRELQELVRRPAPRATRRGETVLILPGIMGSTLGTPQRIIDDVVWLNPFAIGRGRTTELSLDRSPALHQSLDAIPYFYYFLRRRLSSEGFKVRYFHYDWRQDLGDTADQLAQEIRDDASSEVNLIGHSMGGLIARLAMLHTDINPKVKRLIMMGTPNHGSFNALQVFDGTHSVTTKVEKMDLRHDMGELVDELFVSLPACYQLLPFMAKYNPAGVYDSTQWPTNFTAPRQELLNRAIEIAGAYPAPDQRYFLIASAAHQTAVGAVVTPSEITYDLADNAGDGTVPLSSALLPGVKTKLVGADHQGLPNDSESIGLVVDLLRSTPDAWPDDQPIATRRAEGRRSRITATDIRKAVPFDGRSGDALTAKDHRETLEAIFRPMTLPGTTSGTSTTLSSPIVLNGQTISERPRRRLEITLARGSLTEVDTNVIVAGMFQGINATSGATLALDELLGGSITELTSRRMFDAQTGQIYMMPCQTRRIGADMLVLAGLGRFDQLTEEMYRFAVSNVVRTLVRNRISELATVVFGANSSLPPLVALKHLLAGILDGLSEADQRQQFRRLILCELDHHRFEEMKPEVLRLSLSGFFYPAEIILDEVDLGQQSGTEENRQPTAVGRDAPASAYLSVRMTRDETDTFAEYSLLRPSGKATVFQGTVNFSNQAIDSLLAQVGTNSFNVERFGNKLTETVFPKTLIDLLKSPEMKDTHLTVINDQAASRVPWETTRFSDVIPSLMGGMSRRYSSGGLSVAKWLDKRMADPVFSVLLVVNPTEDLAGAAEEGDAVEAILRAIPKVSIDRVNGKQATRVELKQRFSSGKYDMVHYAGHAAFKPESPGDSGIECQDGPLTGNDLAELATLPTLMFFNACESARVRRGSRTRSRPEPTEEPALRLARTVSFAESFLVNGIAHLIGTYWPVGDASAALFAKELCGALAKGATVGSALIAAREALFAAKSIDWANYIHYGDPNFSLKYEVAV